MEEIKNVQTETEEVQGAAESMEDYAAELEASYKALEQNKPSYEEDENPDAEKWQSVKQLMDEKTVVKVKVKEAVKGGVVTYLEELRAFIPASQISIAVSYTHLTMRSRILKAVRGGFLQMQSARNKRKERKTYEEKIYCVSVICFSCFWFMRLWWE